MRKAKIKKGRDKRNNQANQSPQSFDFVTTPLTDKRNATTIKPRTDAQHRYMQAIKSETLIFATGPAGTGKTYLCAALAAEALENKRIDKIILTRPAVEAGEKLGFLPGELEEKYEPYLQPFRDVFNERLGASFAEYLIKHKRIEPAPLAYLRGRAFKNCWVILDEAQNTTPLQMKMFLTRIGENCKVIVNGDLAQKDIPGKSGLEDAVSRLSDLNDSRIVAFASADVVRSGIVKDILERYEPDPVVPGIMSEPMSLAA